MDTKTLDSAMADMIPETYSSATGKDEVDSSYKLYIAATDALATIDANVTAKQQQIEDLKYNNSNTPQTITNPNPVYVQIQKSIADYQHDRDYLATNDADKKADNGMIDQYTATLKATVATITTANPDWTAYQNQLKALNDSLTRLAASRTTQAAKASDYKSQWQDAQKRYGASADQDLATQKAGADIAAKEMATLKVAADIAATKPLKVGFMSKLSKTQKIAGAVGAVVVVGVITAIIGHKKFGWWTK